MRKSPLSRVSRVVCVTASVALSLCMLPSAAFATVGETNNGTTYVSSGGVTVVEDVDYQENDLALLATAEDYALDENGAPSLKPGNHVRWIDRIKIPPQYVTLYNTLVSESRDANGCLVNPAADESIEVASGSLGPLTFTTSASSESERRSEVDNYLKGLIDKAVKEARSYTYAAANAFDADHPEVFWLTGVNSTLCRIWCGWDGSCTQNGNSYTYSITPNAGWELRYSVRRSDGFDAREDNYRDANAIAADITERDADVATIIDDVTENGTITSDYMILSRLNRWLTVNNDYNTCVAEGESAEAPKSAWECTSALDGRSGEEGPVCEGYARAFKVVCDKLGISCVLTQGLAKEDPEDEGTGHMWNYVQVDGKWYGEDATWNDPIGSEGTDTSGNENYFLVGANTVINEMAFIDSHVVVNRRSTSSNAVHFTNGPVLESKSYRENLEGKEVLTWNGEFNWDNGDAPYILADNDGRCPADRILDSLAVNDERPAASSLEFSCNGTPVSIDSICSGAFYEVKLSGNESAEPISFAVVKPNDIWLLPYWLADDARVVGGTVCEPVFCLCVEDAEYCSGSDFQLEYYDPEAEATVAAKDLQPEHGYLAIPAASTGFSLENEFGIGLEFYVKGANNLGNYSSFSLVNWGEAFVDDNDLLNLGGFKLAQWDEERGEDVALPEGTYELLVYSSREEYYEGGDPLNLNVPIADAKALKNAIIVYRAVEGGPYVGEDFCDLRLFGKYNFAGESFCIVDGKPQLSIVVPTGDPREDTLVPSGDYNVRLYANDDFFMENEIAPQDVVLGECYLVAVEGVTSENSNSLFIYREDMKAVAANDISLHGCVWESGGSIDAKTGLFQLPEFRVFDYGQHAGTAREPGSGYKITGVSRWDDELDDYVGFDLAAIDDTLLNETLRFTLSGTDDFTGTTYAYCYVEYDNSGIQDLPLGDVNLDGIFDVRDLVLTQRYLSGLESFSQIQLTQANVFDEDNEVNVKDLVSMARQLLG